MPNFLVLSDIHANLEALRAVLDHAQQHHPQIDAIWCLGDLVGYGPDPGPCLDLLRGDHPLTGRVPVVCVKGNHDVGVLGAGQEQIDESTSPSVRESWEWSFRMLSQEQRDYLAGLPEQLVYANLPQSVLLVHAAPPNDMHRYLRVPPDVDAVVDDLQQTLCFFGHTHLPCYFEYDATRREVKPRLFPSSMRAPITIRGDKALINPGTVGQPRWGRLVTKKPADQLAYPLAYQGIKRGSYLWVDLQADSCRVQCHYVDYPYKQTIAKLRQLATHTPTLAVPERWITRLEVGLR